MKDIICKSIEEVVALINELSEDILITILVEEDDKA